MSHGVPRPATRAERTAEVRKKELQEIDQYQKLVEQVKIGVEKKDYTPELLEQTSALLKKNPEYYTIWNVRRNIFQNEFRRLKNQVESNELTEDRKQSQVLDIINLDLYFLLPLLLQYPKCYWIWNHRLWVLEQGTEYLAPAKARSLWQDELNLVNKMLGRDGRNFHGWGYRRIVVAALEDPKLEGESMAKDEYDYTTKMIRQNLSNFSAWHNRTQLIRRMLDGQGAEESERLKMLFDERDFTHKALIDVYDQSIWFYHQSLLAACDPDLAEKSIAPGLSHQQRISFMKDEQEFVEDLIEDADDCKWLYQALLNCALIQVKLDGQLSPETKENAGKWLKRLKQLDPMRSGRWIDLEKKLLS